MLARHGIEKYELRWRVSGDPFRSPAGALREALRDVLSEQLGMQAELLTENITWRSRGGRIT